MNNIVYLPINIEDGCELPESGGIALAETINGCWYKVKQIIFGYHKTWLKPLSHEEYNQYLKTKQK